MLFNVKTSFYQVKNLFFPSLTGSKFLFWHLRQDSKKFDKKGTEFLISRQHKSMYIDIYVYVFLF